MAATSCQNFGRDRTARLNDMSDTDRGSVVESHLGVGITQMLANPDLFVVLA
jgi:hypothetical protein